LRLTAVEGATAKIAGKSGLESSILGVLGNGPQHWHGGAKMQANSYHTLPAYGAGKFHKRVDVVAHAATLCGCDEEIGDVDEHGLWYGFVAGFSIDPPFADVTPQALLNLSAVEREFLRSHRAFILQTDDMGFVEVAWYVDGEAAAEDWAAIRRWEASWSK
jgi:hypothetical protein